MSFPKPFLNSLPGRAIPCAGAALALLTVALLPPPAAQAGSPPTYTFHLVGTPSGPLVSGTYLQVSGVNDAGQVVGTARGSTATGGTALAFLSAPNGGTPHTLGTLPGDTYSQGLAVNNAGQVAGDSTPANTLPTASHAFLSDPNGGALHDLGTLGGYSSSAAGVNNAGQVAGSYYETAYGIEHAFVSDPNGGALHDLGALLDGYSSHAVGVNSTGQVVGNCYGTGTYIGVPGTFAFLSDPNGGALHDLGTLPGDILSVASGVNDAGQVVGYSAIDDMLDGHAFLSDPNGGTLHDLGTLGGAKSFASGINNAGQVVGGSETAQFTDDAFLFTGGQMYDLNSLITNGTGGFTLSDTLSISNTGFIAGDSRNAAGQIAAFLLTPNASPVPEASTLVSFGLLVLSMGAWIVSARRKVPSAE